MRFLVTCLATLCSLIGYAGNDCDCAAIGVEYLFLKPSIYDPYFAVPSSQFSQSIADLPEGTRLANLWSYHLGVRVKGLYNLSCTRIDLYGEGLYFKDQAKRSIVFADDGLGTKGFPGPNLEELNTANSMVLRYRLWSLKGGLRYCFDICYPLLVSTRFAIQYANLSMREKILYEDLIEATQITNVDYNMHSWGVGPEIGFDTGCEILSCFSIVTRGSFALLAGRISSSLGGIEVQDGVIEDLAFSSNDKMSIVIPAYELKLGLNYDWPFDCFCANLEVGYDFIYYDNVFDYVRWFDDDVEGLSSDQFTPFMVHGPYISLNTKF